MPHDTPNAPPAPPTTRAQTSPAQRAGAAILELGRLPGKFTPPRIVLYGVEGWGKTSCVAHAEDAAIIMAAGETGYETLLGAGLVPQVDVASATNWTALLATLDKLATADSVPYKVLALDAIGGIERLCHTHVCNRDFDGDWGEKGFTSYQKGYDVAVTDWLQLLQRLDNLRACGVTIVLLGHVQIRSFRNPTGEDFDRYVSAIHHKTWSATHRWADAVLFGQFRTITAKLGGSSSKKGIGGTDRILYCERRDAYDAKNRYGMAAEIDIPADPAQVWDTIWKALTAGKA